MAEYKAEEVGKTGLDGAIVGGKVRVYRNTFALSSQATGSTLVCRPLPANGVVVGITIGGTTSLGTATIKVGDKDDDDGLVAAATFTAETLKFPATEAYRECNGRVPVATTATAALPADGKLYINFWVAERR